VTVTGRVVEVTPNVTGQIVAIPVKPNVPVKANDALFQIDPAPFQSKVTQLQASLAGAKQQVEILKAYYEQATANVTGLTAQVAYNKKRLADIDTLAADMANTEFQAQDKQVQHETVSTQLGAAKAAQQSAASIAFFVGRDKLTGWDVARHAREIDAGFPVVYITGANADDWASKGVPNSILLSKPLAQEQLLTAVSQLLNADSQTV
jgi:multidrug efflux pump subunit AcrA (membrane-fusion protein)